MFGFKITEENTDILKRLYSSVTLKEHALRRCSCFHFSYTSVQDSSCLVEFICPPLLFTVLEVVAHLEAKIQKFYVTFCLLS